MTAETTPIVVVDVDLTAGVPCAVPDCPTDATWAATNLCPARHTSLCCEEHRAEAVAWADWARRDSVTVICTTCGHPLTYPYQTWRTL